jgi:hypothetical protein
LAVASSLKAVAYVPPQVKYQFNIRIRLLELEHSAEVAIRRRLLREVIQLHIPSSLAIESRSFQYESSLAVIESERHIGRSVPRTWIPPFLCVESFEMPQSPNLGWPLELMLQGGAFWVCQTLAGGCYAGAMVFYLYKPMHFLDCHESVMSFGFRQRLALPSEYWECGVTTTSIPL